MSQAPTGGRELSFLAFDFGAKRTGVASGNTVTRSATPLTTIATEKTDERFAAVEKLIREWRPDALVVVRDRIAPDDNFESRLKQPTLIGFDVFVSESGVQGVIFLVISSWRSRSPMLEREAPDPYPLKN